MSVAALVLAFVLLVLLALRFALTVPPQKAARALRLVGPAALVAVGGIATLLGRGAVGVPLVGWGLAWLGRARSRNRQAAAEAGGETSSVRTVFLDMRLDHDTGAMDGTILDGRFAGVRLSDLSDAELLLLRRELTGDPDSLSLAEAYLDRRAPAWRDAAQAHAGNGLGGAPGAGPMSEQEAYEVLGLEPGASLADIREAHRRLMKRVHPDHGGTHRLAARVNEAKAVLIDRHV